MVNSRVSIAFAILGAVGCGTQPLDMEAEVASLLPDVLATPSQELQPEDDKWATAIKPREFKFPADHGSHRDFRIEWWYYTGNLQTEAGRRFGYQLTFFRTGVQRDPSNPSQWVVEDLYTAHFAIADLQLEQHHSAQKSRRAGVGTAGAANDRLKVWNGSWSAIAEGERHHLNADTDDFALDLQLSPGKGIVLQGDNGLSQKGAATGNASYYYSLPRMPTVGVIEIEGTKHKVSGESWMDHEFSTSFLEQGQRGWDWLSMQLNDGSELMLYQMRRSDGSVDSHSSGTIVPPDGPASHLTAEEFTMLPGNAWRSSETGAEYPLTWKIEVPKLDLQLEVAPAFEAQEMATEATTGIAYWEGSVEANGKRGEAAITGRGYLELTGYTETELGSMLGE